MKPFELKDAMQVEIRAKGTENSSKFIAAITQMYANATVLQLLSPEKATLLLNCASNVIICNVRLQYWSTRILQMLIRIFYVALALDLFRFILTHGTG